MKKNDILQAIADGRAKFWPAQDALVIERPNHPIRVFRRTDLEYAIACTLVETDLATQEYVPLGSPKRKIPLLVTDKGRQVLRAARAPRQRGRGRARAEVSA